MNRDIITHTAHSVLGFAEMTQQEVVFTETLLRGLPLRMAAEAAGTTVAEAQEMLIRPHVAQVLAYMREQNMSAHVEVNRDMLNLMLLESHAKAASATEEINAARELGKMNGLYADSKVQHTVTDDRAKSAKQLRHTDTDELVQLAGYEYDGEWEEVPDDDGS